MADVFHEVEEQLRSARIQAFFLRAWPYAAGVAVVVLLAFLTLWGVRKHETARDGAASETYGQALQALQKGDVAGADKRFAELARSGPKTYRSMALMQQADLRLKENKAADAVRLLDQAAEAAPSPVLGDAARLKAAYVLMDTAPYDQVAAQLTPLTAQDHPYRAMAREALALERLQTGRLTQARGDFQVLTLTSDASDQTRARAQAALSMIDAGTAANLGAAVHIASTLPQPPPGAGLPGQPQPAPSAGAAQ